MIFTANLLSAPAALGSGSDMKLYALIFMVAVTVILLTAAILFFWLNHRHKMRMLAMGKRVRTDPLKAVLGFVLLVGSLAVFCLTLFSAYTLYSPVFSTKVETAAPTQTTAPTTVPPATTAPETTPPTTEATVPPTTVETVPPTEPDPLENFHPHHTENSDPANWGIEWEIMADGEMVDSYTREDPIFFGEPEQYTQFAGVSTFRGNNYRDGGAYGTAVMDNEQLTTSWYVKNGTLNDWPGCGWTGQPLVVQWDQQTKSIMNMYDSAKEKEDLVEVIYGTLDGYIYFLDMETGEATRDRIWIGYNFKGSGSLDPRGYPLLYIGSGTLIGKTYPRMHIVNLITGKVEFTGGNYDQFAPRHWFAFDSAPLVSADTDTLIWPGESGVLYTMKLNTDYDKENGALTIAPDNVVKIRYDTNFSTSKRYWVGMEDSACIVGNYLYIADNAGMFFCMDLNTMELIWAQNIKDDTNCTPIFEWGEDNNGYLYIAPSLHWTAKGGWGEISLYKLDAQTGEIIWERPYECGTVTDLSGGVQSSPVLGRPGTNMEGLIIFSISYTPKINTGLLVALDTDTGEEVWRLQMNSYSWCSPVAVYNSSGEGYLVMPTFETGVLLLDGATGDHLDGIDLHTHIESTPVVFNNMVVLGTRGCTIYGLTLS